MRRPLLFWSLCLVAVIAWLYYGRGSFYGSVLPNERTITLTGQIYQKDETSFILKIQKNAIGQWQENQQIHNFNIWFPDRVLCELEGASGLFLGATVTVEGTFYAMDGASNPGEFDYAAYYRSRRISGRLRRVRIVEYRESSFGAGEVLYRLRNAWERRLYRIFPDKEASVMAAVLLGDKSGVDSDLKELYQRNGIIHILSISGLHITLIGMGIYHLLRRLGMPVWLAALMGGMILTLYGVMTGLGVSACRAIGMYLLRMLALLWGRTYDMLTALGVTAAVLVLCNPAYLEAMGFWLSFGSILGIGMLLPALLPMTEEAAAPKGGKKQPRGNRQGKVWVKLAGGIWESVRTGLSQSLYAGLSVTLTTLPLQLWFAYEIPVYSVLLNLLVLPFMSVLMICGILAVGIPGLGVVGTADVLILTGYEKLCRWFGTLPFHTWNPGRPEIWQMVLYYGLWFLVIWGTDLWRRREKKREWQRAREPRCAAGGKISAKAIGRGRFLVLTVAVLSLGISLPKGERITFLDVGQGDCICVQTSFGEVYLFDCGSSSRSHIGEKVLIPFLKYHGITHVDGVFLSHPDADHMNGLIELLALSGQEHISVGQVILPAVAKKDEEDFQELFEAMEKVSGKRDFAVGYVQAADELWKGGAQKGGRFLCLHPSADFPTGDENAYSECFYLEFAEGFSLLLTGDVEKAGEAALLEELRRQKITEVTALKVAHHGSRNATSKELLETVSPKLAVISCGRNNRYGHPHRELLERLSACVTQVYRTDREGAVTITLRKGKIRVERFRR